MRFIKIAVIIILIASIIAVGGCSRSSNEGDVNTITVGIADYMANRNIIPNPEISFRTTVDMLDALRAGEIDVAYVHIGAGETPEFEGFESHLIGTIPIAFVAAISNPVNSITLEQLKGIMHGEITNWADVGGLDEPIYVGHIHPEWFNLAIGESIDATVINNNENLTHGWIDNVFAFDSLDRIVARLENNHTLKPIAIDGVLPYSELISSGNYPFMINVYAIIYENSDNYNLARLHVFTTIDSVSREVNVAAFVGRSPYNTEHNRGFAEFWNTIMEFHNNSDADYELFNWAAFFE